MCSSLKRCSPSPSLAEFGRGRGSLLTTNGPWVKEDFVQVDLVSASAVQLTFRAFSEKHETAMKNFLPPVSSPSV